MKKFTYLIGILFVAVLVSCQNRGEEKVEKPEDPFEQIEESRDSIPTEGDELGEMVNNNQDTLDVDSAKTTEHPVEVDSVNAVE